MSGVSSHEILNPMCFPHFRQPVQTQLPAASSGPQRPPVPPRPVVWDVSWEPSTNSDTNWPEKQIKGFQCSSALLVQPKCLWKAGPSWKAWVPRGTEHRLVTPQSFAPCCWLCLCLLYLSFTIQTLEFNMHRSEPGSVREQDSSTLLPPSQATEKWILLFTDIIQRWEICTLPPGLSSPQDTARNSEGPLSQVWRQSLCPALTPVSWFGKTGLC